jgi:drug/metabolite transporter (DMT)-like permease
MATLSITPSKTNVTGLAAALLLAVALAWGSSYGITKEVLAITPVFTFMVMRFGLTVLLTLPMIWKELRDTSFKVIGTGLCLGVLLFAIFIAEIYGILYLDASLAAVLISLCILFTPLMESRWLKVAISPQLVKAIPVSLIGIGLICFDQIDGWSINRGVWLILLAAVLRAAMAVATKATFNKMSYSPLFMTAVQSFVVTLGSVTVLLTSGTLDTLFQPIALSQGLRILYLVLFCTILAFAAMNYGIKKTSAGQASFLMAMEPVFGVLFGVLWLSEVLTPLQWLGCALVIMSTYLVLRKTAK